MISLMISLIKITNTYIQFSIFYLMGNSYCEQCCENRDLEPNTLPPNTQPVQQDIKDDSPPRSFGKLVKQHIELNKEVQNIHANYKKNHQPQQKGTKLDLYYLHQYAAYYDGQWKKGLPHGNGKLIYDDGSIYDGCFRQGFADCDHALFIRNSGSIYMGMVRNNKAEGQGKLIADEFMIQGDWKNDLPDGKAKQWYNPVSSYEGQFREGVKEGMGTYKWNAKESYTGQFRNNMMHGKGKLTTQHYVYKGSFVNGQRHGEGHLSHLTKGFQYIGNFKHGLFHGEGEYKWNDGTIFEGTFCDNFRVNGVYKLSNGTIVKADNMEEISQKVNI